MNMRVRFAAQALGIPVANSQKLPDGDLEIRFWSGFGLEPYVHLIYLKRIGGHWSLQSGKAEMRFRDTDPPVGVTYDPTNKQFWGGQQLQPPVDEERAKQIGEGLVQRGLLSFPENLSDECDDGWDGLSHLVEVTDGPRYLTYDCWVSVRRSKSENARKFWTMADWLLDNAAPEWMLKHDPVLDSPPD